MIPLTEQELHNLAMNIVGRKLQEMGYEFLAVNSKLKKHPQFVLYKKDEPTTFVLVKATNNLQNPHEYDSEWMEWLKPMPKNKRPVSGMQELAWLMRKVWKCRYLKTIPIMWLLKILWKFSSIVLIRYDLIPIELYLLRPN